MDVLRVDEFDEDYVSEKLIEIYERTSDWLWFSTTLHPSFFNRDDVREAITGLCGEDIPIRLLLDEDVDVQHRRESVGWIFDQDCIDIRQSTRNIDHRVISDGVDLRLEKDHDTGEMGAANLIAMDAVDEFSTPYRREFESWWEEAVSV